MTKEVGETLPQASLQASALMSNVPSAVNSGNTTVSCIAAKMNQSTPTLVNATKNSLIMKARTSA